MSKHTPGPWQYAFEGGTVAFIVELDGTTVAELSTTENSTAHIDLPANARLIAAAPELLEALKTLVGRVDPDKQAIYNFLRKDWETAIRAINRAEAP